MSYLVCEKCSGYYKLKEGEKPEDPQNLIFWDQENEVFYGFESCECGGTLKYVQNFNSHFDEELDPLNELNICPDCGTENHADEKNCISCGKTLNIKNKEPADSNKDKAVNESKTFNGMIIRAISIIVGILIVLIPAFLFVNQNYSLSLLLIAGAVTSFIAGGKSEDGALNGIIMGLIAASLLLIFKGNFMFTSDVFFNLEVIIYEMGGAILILALFGLIGGVIGAVIRQFLIKN